MNDLAGRMMACQLMIAGLAARVANASDDPIRFITDFRDEMHAVAAGVRIAGVEDEQEVRACARRTLDELFSLMKSPSSE